MQHRLLCGVELVNAASVLVIVKPGDVEQGIKQAAANYPHPTTTLAIYAITL